MKVYVVYRSAVVYTPTDPNSDQMANVSIIGVYKDFDTAQAAADAEHDPEYDEYDIEIELTELK